MVQERVVKLGFIGAGNINFGPQKGQKSQGPWNHSKRLQELPGVQFTAVVDPNIELAKARIESLRRSPEHGAKWAGAKAFKNSGDMLASQEKPDAVFVGVPPLYHGSPTDPKADVELQLAKAGLNLFIEKPLSVKPAEEVAALGDELKKLQQQHSLVFGVGYMLRYSSAVQAAKRLLQEYNAKPVSIMGRYACAYSNIKQREWWDTAVCGGPIVEQATHFIDLMRYFGGEIAEESIKAVAVGPSLSLSDMPAAPSAEHTVASERRINRATTALFRFKEGAIGSLTHTVLLHESIYHTAFEILADGLHIIIEDPYDNAKVTARRPHSDVYEQLYCSPLAYDNIMSEDKIACHTFSIYAHNCLYRVLLQKEDMYVPQAKAFVEAVRNQNSSEIRSTYADAVESYKVSQWITAASSADRSN